jgi:hypothetical protein
LGLSPVGLKLLCLILDRCATGGENLEVSAQAVGVLSKRGLKGHDVIEVVDQFNKHRGNRQQSVIKNVLIMTYSGCIRSDQGTTIDVPDFLSSAQCAGRCGQPGKGCEICDFIQDVGAFPRPNS